MTNKTTYNFIKLNCTEESFVECWIAHFIWRSVPFILVTIGTFGNGLNLVVLSRKQIRKYSTSVYLLFLSGSDIVVLWSGAVVDTNESINGIVIKNTSSFMCRFSRFFTMTSAGFSAWLLVLMTFERIFLSMKHLVAYPKMTPRFAFTATSVLLSTIVLFTGHLIFGFKFGMEYIPMSKNESQLLEINKCIFQSTGYMEFYKDIWGLLILIFLNVIPVILIVFGNIVILIQVLRYRNHVQRIFPETATARRVRQRKSPAKMLFLVSVIFLVTTLPYTIYLVAKNEFEDLNEHSIAKHQLLTSILLMLLYSNFTFNFILYFVSGTLFKKEWHIIVDEMVKACRRISCLKKKSQTDIIRLQNFR